MSYRANGSQQLSIFDRSLRLTRRERSFLEKSWAKVFSDEIFPAIDEERFRVLYSQNASRPNTPVNIIVGALIIKELFALSDDEIVENLMLDIHYQYALHTTSYEEQPLSDKSLSRFRKRCYEYEKTTGVDLFHECVCDLNRKIAKLMGINSHIKRMDSLMIEANIRKLSRIELLYSCVARLAKRIEKKEGTSFCCGVRHNIRKQRSIVCLSDAWTSRPLPEAAEDGFARRERNPRQQLPCKILLTRMRHTVQRQGKTILGMLRMWWRVWTAAVP